MKYQIIKNRKLVEDENFAGYNKENRAEMLEFEIPEALSEYTATINFETDDGNVNDLLDNGRYILKNNITKYDKVRFYLEFTKEISENNLDLIKTEVKTIEFGDSFDVNTEITEEEINIIDTLIAQTNSAINRANAISEDLENKLEDIYLSTAYLSGKTLILEFNNGRKICVDLSSIANNTSEVITPEQIEAIGNIRITNENDLIIEYDNEILDIRFSLNDNGELIVDNNVSGLNFAINNKDMEAIY